MILGNGRWFVEGQQLILDGDAGEHWLLFGDSNWTDYDFSFEAKHENGASGLRALFRSPDPSRVQQFAYGWINSRTAAMSYAEGERRFQKIQRGGSPVTKVMDNPMHNQQGYRLRVVIRGKSTKAYCDDTLIFGIENNPFDRGRVGVGTWYSSSGKLRISDILILAPDKSILWKGPPEIIESRPTTKVPEILAAENSVNNLRGRFAPLFDGNNLSNWTFPLGEQSCWSVKEGAIHGLGNTDGCTISTAKTDYGNFHLKMDVRTNDDLNKQLIIRGNFAPDDFKGYVIWTGIQRVGGRTAKLGEYRLKKGGGPFDGNSLTMDGLREIMAPTEDVFAKNKSQHVDIIAIPNVVRVLIDERVVSAFEDTQSRLKRGQIAFRVLNGGQIEIRNIEIKE